jgi:hypothetical protein
MTELFRAHAFPFLDRFRTAMPFSMSGSGRRSSSVSRPGASAARVHGRPPERTTSSPRASSSPLRQDDPSPRNLAHHKYVEQVADRLGYSWFIGWRRNGTPLVYPMCTVSAFSGLYPTPSATPGSGSRPARPAKPQVTGRRTACFVLCASFRRIFTEESCEGRSRGDPGFLLNRPLHERGHSLASTSRGGLGPRMRLRAHPLLAHCSLGMTPHVSFMWLGVPGPAEPVGGGSPR